jgi:ATP dependent DNA ligase domain
VLDGEIVCLDSKGKPQFRDLLFRRGDPYFFAFDLLAVGDKDWRTERLTDRKQELRRLMKRVPADSRLHYVDHVEGLGTALFQRVCEMDLEGIVAKYKFAPYVADRESSTWFKLRNRGYSQMAGREQLFERERHQGPVAGWHSCVVACAELEELSRSRGSRKKTHANSLADGAFHCKNKLRETTIPARDSLDSPVPAECYF